MFARVPCVVCSFCFCIAISLPTSRLHSVSCTVRTPPHPYIPILYPQPHTVHTYTSCVSFSHIQYIHILYPQPHPYIHILYPQPHTVHTHSVPSATYSIYTFCTPSHIQYIPILYPQPHTVHTYICCVYPQPHTVHTRPVSFSCIRTVHTYIHIHSRYTVYLSPTYDTVSEVKSPY